LWDARLALGISVAGRWLFADKLGVEAELSGAQSLNATSNVSTRLVEGALAARFVPLSHTAVTLGLRAGLAEVRASGDLQLVDSAANDCGLEGNGGWCPLSSAEIGLWWSPEWIGWHPEIGATLAWSRRSIAVLVDDSGEPVSSVPNLRPSVIVRLAWSDQ
jgi:hypothetical protein